MKSLFLWIRKSVFFIITGVLLSTVQAAQGETTYPDYFIDILKIDGNKYIVQGETPEPLIVKAGVSCSYLADIGQPNKSIKIEYTLNGPGIDNPVTATQVIPSENLVWELCLYDFAPGPVDRCSVQDGLIAEQSIPMPASPSTGVYTLLAVVSVQGSTRLYVEQDRIEKSFCYSVFSGKINFGKVRAQLDSLQFAKGTFSSDFNCLCPDEDGSYLPVKISSMEGHIELVDTEKNFSGTNLFFGYSASVANQKGLLDLTLTAGTLTLDAPLKTLSDEFGLEFNNIQLNATGGRFTSVTLFLPENISFHKKINSIINPRGLSKVLCKGETFNTNTLGDVTVGFSDAYYVHSYGLPFYMGISGFSFPIKLSSDTGLLLNPTGEVEYVHGYQEKSFFISDGQGGQQEVPIVSKKDQRRVEGFPSNDIFFSYPSAFENFTITRSGVSADIFFYNSGKSTANATQTSRPTFFPRASMIYDAWTVRVENGTLIPEGTIDISGFRFYLNQNCADGFCGDTLADSLYAQSGRATLLSNGALGFRFEKLFNPAGLDVEGASLAWGGYNSKGTTYKRYDTGKPGTIVVPGFLMPETGIQGTPADVHDTLLGSFTFDENGIEALHLLGDPGDDNADSGNGFFAGLTMGPETLVGQENLPAEGRGRFLNGQTHIRFNANSSYTAMDDREAVKYVLRPSGIIGLFNTRFSGPVTIYDYNLEFYRFAFRQDRNLLDDETFIDGELTLNGPVGGNDGMRVGFTNLNLTCKGNLGAGMVDSESETQWPMGAEQNGSPVCGDGFDGDGDSRVDEGCQVLNYWNVPILYLGMAFVNAPADSGNGECNSNPRLLNMLTKNKIDGLDSPLTMSANYSPQGTLSSQKITGRVDTVFDGPATGKERGFSLRLKKAYLNQVSPDLPEWEGFTVLSGITDVPLFDDARLSGHFVNRTATDFKDYSLYLFKDETDVDPDADGVPNGLSYGGVDAYRDLLKSDTIQTAMPVFEYQWPSSGMIDLNYHGVFEQSTPGQGPKFIGRKRATNLADVLTITSVPDFITPDRTKFSFGASADLSALSSVLVDVSNLSGNLDSFLENTLGVNPSLKLETMLSELVDAEGTMLSLTGGDLTGLLGDLIDASLETWPIAHAIKETADHLNIAHHVSYGIRDAIIDPVFAVREKISLELSADLYESFGVLFNSLAPFAFYNPEMIKDIPGYDLGRFNDDLAYYEKIKIHVNDTIATLESALDAVNAGKAYLDVAAGNIDALIGAVDLADNKRGNLYGALDELSDYTDSSIDVNPIFNSVDGIKKVVQSVKKVQTAVNRVDIVAIAQALETAASLSGASIDTSMITSAKNTIKTAIDQLNEQVNAAEQNMSDLFAQSGVADMLLPVENILKPGGVISVTLAQIRGNLEQLKDPLIMTSLDHVQAGIAATISMLETVFANDMDIDNPPGNWVETMTYAQNELNLKIADEIVRLKVNADPLSQYLDSLVLPDASFEFIFQAKFSQILDIPMAILLDAGAQGTLAGIVKDLETTATSVLAAPTQADIRTMIKNLILNTNAVENINRLVYEQMGFITDVVDNVTTQLTSQINGLIKQAIAVVDEALSTSLKDVTAGIGESQGWSGIKSTGVDGYAVVSQDEVERIHVEAQFTFESEPEDTSYNAALDITTWNAEDGKGACAPDGGSGNVDVMISTHDVTADMLGMDVGLKEAALGFTMAELVPVGVFGRVYLAGELDFQVLTLEDLGLESGFGLYEVYFGGTGAGRFEEYRITKAAFFLGKSCSFSVLERLDSEVAEFIGKIEPLTGAFVRGAAEVPIFNMGCSFRVGVGADIGAWYFTKPSPGTYGGIMGGSAYGRLACLASLKGAVSCLGQKSGADYKFQGSGWGAAGVGWCSPGSWDSVSDARRDSWCTTADATFKAVYDGSWHTEDLDINCCD